jgi:hypothetical protein
VTEPVVDGVSLLVVSVPLDVRLQVPLADTVALGEDVTDLE